MHTEAIENLSRSGWIRVDTWKQEGAREFFHRFFPRQRLKKKNPNVRSSFLRGEEKGFALNCGGKKKETSVESIDIKFEGHFPWESRLNFLSNEIFTVVWYFLFFFFCNATRRSHILCKIITRDRGRGIFWRVKIVTLL